MENQHTAPNHTRFIIGCITLLSSEAIVAGYHLLSLGYQSGELLVTSGGVAGISGLVGFLGGRMSTDRPAAPNITGNVSGDVNTNPPPPTP